MKNHAQMMSRIPLWLRPDIARDWGVLKSVFAKHAVIFFLMLGMGLVFMLLGGLTAYYGHGLGAVMVGWVFLLAGSVLTVASVYTNVSSVSYYYESALLKKRGRPVSGVVTHYWSEESRERAEDGATLAIERLYFVRFTYFVGEQAFESEAVIDREDVYSQLQEGMPIPLLVWPAMPSIVRVRQKKLRQDMASPATEADGQKDSVVYSPQPLLSED